MYVPNFKIEDSCRRFLVFGGWRVRGSEVLSSRWFDIWTSECYRGFELFNRKLALMYDGRVEARTREWEHWNSLIYGKQKGENWDKEMKPSSEFKRTKMEWWRQMKTGMWSGFLEVVWSFQRAIVMCQRARGLLGVWGFGLHSVRVSEDGWNGVRGAVGDQSWIRQDLGNWTGISTT